MILQIVLQGKFRTTVTYKMFSKALIFLCFMALLIPLWSLPLPVPDGKRLHSCLFIFNQYFSLLSAL